MTISTLASAQSAITSYTIDGGGGVSEAGNKRITGTIGQADAGVLEGGASRIRGGFWPGAILSGPATATPTPTPTGEGPTATPTPTEIDLDLGVDDDFIDALDLIALLIALKEQGVDPEVLIRLIEHWQKEYGK